MAQIWPEFDERMGDPLLTEVMQTEFLQPRRIDDVTVPREVEEPRMGSGMPS